jgi:exodeoxyribonuclease V gamma subunit
VITYTGHDPRTNEVQQPAVPVSELLDVVDATFTVHDQRPDGSPRTARDVLVTDHPLQPHSPRYFRDATDDEPPVPRAFDHRSLAAARAAAGPRSSAPPFFPPERPLPVPTEDELDPQVVELNDLLRFLVHPVRHLLQRRVGISLGGDDRRLEDRDPTELDSLERWQLGQRLLERRLAGTAPANWREFTLACGTVPVGGLGEVALSGIEELVTLLCDAVADVGERTTLSVDVEVRLPAAAGEEPPRRRVVGAVELYGSHLLHVSVSELKPKHRVPLWPRLLAVTAAAPELEPAARLLGRAKTKAGYRDVLLGPLRGAVDEHDERTPAEAARDHLGALVDIYLRGHRHPVPLLPETSLAYVKPSSRGGSTTMRSPGPTAPGRAPSGGPVSRPMPTWSRPSAPTRPCPRSTRRPASPWTPSGSGGRCWPRRVGRERRRALRGRRAAARRVARAGGQRRHRQDLDADLARRALRRRRSRRPARAAAGHLHPGGHRGAARAGAHPARRGAGRRRAGPGRRRLAHRRRGAGPHRR